MAFLPEEHKRRFAWKFGIILALFFLLQIILPMGIWMSVVIKHMTQGFEMTFLESAERFKNKIYLLTEGGSFDFKKGDMKEIHKLYQLDNDKLMMVPGVEIGDSLLAMIGDSRGIWFFYPDHYELFDGEKVAMSYPLEWEIGKYPIFASDNEKIYIIYTAENKYKMTWLKDAESSKPIEIPHPETRPCCVSTCGNQLVFWQGKFWHFSRVNKKLYLQIIKNHQAGKWQEVGDLPECCYTISYDKDGLFILSTSSAEGNTASPNLFKTPLKRIRIKEGKLATPEIFSLKASIVEPILIGSQDGYARVIGNQFSFRGFNIGHFELTEKFLGEITTLKGLENFNPFASYLIIGFIYIIPILLILLLAIITSVMMPNYRITEITLQNGVKYGYASVLRRVLSQAIDILILLSPLLTLLLLFKAKEKIEDFLNNPFHFFIFMGIIFGASLLWMLISLLYFSILEGRYGWTIGKLIFKIRVLGEEGKPPGFLRALLRNFLKIIDGFFNFMVGVALIAFTERWQRLGDLAARTVVVKKP